MARNTVFKAGQTAALEQAAAAKPEVLSKIVGRSQCDISHLKAGVKVLRVVGDDIECQHPEGPRKFLVAARHFTVVGAES